jgi:group I intron endonuclease
MNIYTIYKIANKINGKIYIGFDSHWPRRKLAHLSGNSKGCRILFSAIKKWGPINFHWEVLFQGWDKDFVLNFAECYFINEYNSIECGYNILSGGQYCAPNKGKIFSDETKEKMRKKALGRKHTKDTLEKMSAKAKGNKNCVGRKYSSISLEKMHLAKLGKSLTREHQNNIKKGLLLTFSSRKKII